MERYPPETRAELVDEICARIAEGKSLVAICRDPAMPDYRTIMRWVANDEETRQKYVRAREDSADADAENISDIGGRVLTGEIDPAAARVAIDALKWTAGRKQPRKYGDKLELSGDRDRPLNITVRAFGDV